MKVFDSRNCIKVLTQQNIKALFKNFIIDASGQGILSIQNFSVVGVIETYIYVNTIRHFVSFKW